MVNGTDKCNDEANNFLSICPNFILDSMRENKLRKIDNRLTQLREYEFAMSEGEYNKGRSLKDVDGRKTYVDGLRKNLRPNTIWNDERYIDVNQEDIDAAKQRHQARLDKQGYKPKESILKTSIDKEYSHLVTEKPLYH